MYPDDYQLSALYGPAPNNSQINAMTLNPAANGPDDWATILTNGISGAAVNGINGAIANAVQAGQLQNVATAQGLGIRTTGMSGGNGSIVPLLIIGAVLIALVR
ncbi:MAG: hypothetical protein V4476_19560 [Pseudomonadota bacterium]